MDKTRLYISELLGTFVLVFIGVGSVNNATTPLLAIALAFGLAVAVVASTIGHISGAHLNPAVTLAMLVTGRIPVGDAVAYMISQLAGAVLASAAIKGLLPAGHPDGVTALAGVTSMQGLGLETLATFLLVFVIFGTAIDMRSQKLPPLFIGLTVTLDILVLGGVTGASMNPARSFGPAVINGKWDTHWLYWVGPLLGGVLAAIFYTKIFLPRTSAEARPEVRPDAAAESAR